SRIALVSCSPSPAPGSCGALDTGGAAADVAGDGDAPTLGSRTVTRPLRLPSWYQRRSDSVVHPMVSAISSRFMSAAISERARACSSGENRRPRAETRLRLLLLRGRDFEEPL